MEKRSFDRVYYGCDLPPFHNGVKLLIVIFRMHLPLPANWDTIDEYRSLYGQKYSVERSAMYGNKARQLFAAVDFIPL